MLSSNSDQATNQTGASTAGAGVVFFEGSRGFTAADVINAAEFRGELTAPFAQLTAGLACAQQADAEGVSPEPDIIQTLSEEFRYQRDLISAEEMEAWLIARGLTVEDFEDYCARLYWNRKRGDTVQAEPCSYVTAHSELRTLVRAELHFMGLFDPFAKALAWRVAAYSASTSPAAPEALARERANFLRRHTFREEDVNIWLSELGCGPGWLEEMLCLEIAFNQERLAVLTPEARTRTFQIMRLSLVQFTLETMLLPSLSAAQEARLCLLEDGFTMSELSIETGWPVKLTRVCLSNLPYDEQPRFLSAVPGTLLDLRLTDEGYEIIRVAAKSEPVLEDEEVARKIEEHILEGHFQEITSRQIQWPRNADITHL